MLKKMTPAEYRKYADLSSPKSSLWLNVLRAFVVGGLICVIGQLIYSLFIYIGMDKDSSSSFTSMTLIFLGAFFTGLNIYDDLGRFAGAGSIVPITGFANSIVSPAMEFKREGYIMGVGARMFIIAGPVLVFGITASVAVGIIYFFLK